MNAVLSPNPAAFRLGDLLVYPATGRVSGPGGEVHLEPRVMAVLELLARRQGELVSRAELLAEIWPGGDIYDEALTQCVYQLRQQLLGAGGSDESRNIIATVPKRGYVLKADIEPVEPASVPDARVDSNRSKFMAAGLIVLLVLAVAWGIFQWRTPTDTAISATQAGSIAVLPFLPLVADQGEPVLEMGIADTLITRLSGISDLVVRPMSSARRYADLERDSLQAGRQLGVDAVVDGSIQRHDDTIRVTVRLLRVSDGHALWAETMSEPFSNIFEVQDEICARIAAALSLELGQDDRREMARGGTDNTEAYEHYMQGRYHLARLTPRDLLESVDQFRAAVALDPDYTQAWLGLANAQFRLPVAGEAPPAEFYPNAKAAAQRALEIDPNLAEAHAMLGWIAHWYDWDWAASESHFKRAIELDPYDTEGHLGYAHLLLVSGRHEEALAEVRRAREISPFYPVAASLEGMFLARAGRPQDAIQRLEEARQQYANFWLIRLHLAEAYFDVGRVEDALVELQAARQLSGGSTIAMAREVASLARLGRAVEAEALLEEMLQLSAQRYVPPYDLAAAYDGVGEADAALAWLERAYAGRDPKMAIIGLYKWSAISSRPEFVDLLHRMNLSG